MMFFLDPTHHYLIPCANLAEKNRGLYDFEDKGHKTTTCRDTKVANNMSLPFLTQETARARGYKHRDLKYQPKTTTTRQLWLLLL